MLCALTSPEQDASNDFGAIFPPIVFTKTIFCSELSGSASAGTKEVINARVVARIKGERI